VGVGKQEKNFKQNKVDALAIGTGDVYDLKKLQSSEFIDDVTPSTCKMTSCTSGKQKYENIFHATIMERNIDCT
jgi:hypothetical protein